MDMTLEERKGYAKRFAILFVVLFASMAVLFIGFELYSKKSADITDALQRILVQPLLLALILCCFYHGFYYCMKKAYGDDTRLWGARLIVAMITGSPYILVGMFIFIPYYIYNLYRIKRGG